MKDPKVKIVIVITLGAVGIGALCFLEPTQAKDVIDGILSVFNHM